MKPEGHPKFFSDAKFTCVCGNIIVTGSTKKETSIDICNNCHPYYTGKQKMLDVEGRVERFQKRYAKVTVNKPTTT
ncbi:MAG: 50S ribosomal protein L31 [Bdellovibrionales bacterium]|nr:50S ribosomal protein L31 [Bdellovibrionales bacterium]